MQLLERKPYHWELYRDNESLYLNVIINLRIATYEKTVVLDEDAKQAYKSRGKDFIQQLAKQIESSQFRKDYDRFYSYPDATKEQKEQMNKVLNLKQSNY
ncbi:hypothetical protein BEN71_07575 [Acinetobacter wuhouensis]|uniref:hypothetical protein n=1 Tax=Acinetobacter wuhouensis TaxID=1879050 RepID=UPI00083A65B2|nr:hypothetical protein [Acinetobacter wuhouensis]AXQ21929.1 hypothetical protein BEN71_07575 [Acinetobacter wuhouensis]